MKTPSFFVPFVAFCKHLLCFFLRPLTTHHSLLFLLLLTTHHSPLTARADWNIVFSDGTNLSTRASTGTNTYISAIATNAASGTSLLAMSNNTWVTFSPGGGTGDLTKAVADGLYMPLVYTSYVGRGQTTLNRTADVTHAGITMDDTWRALSLSNYMPTVATVKAVDLYMSVYDAASGKQLLFHPYDPNLLTFPATSGSYERVACVAPVASVAGYMNGLCAINTNYPAVVLYNANAGIDAIIIYVKGWCY